MKILFRAILLSLLTSGLYAASAPVMDERSFLKMFVCPAFDEEVLRREFLPLVGRLQSELDVKIRLFPVNSPGRFARTLRRRNMDLAVVSPAVLMDLKKRGIRDSVKVIAAQILNNRDAYRGIVVTRAADHIDSLDNLHQRVLAIADYRSFSGWFRLKQWFGKRGVSPPRFFRGIEQAGGHVEALRMVLEHDADAASVSELALGRAARLGLDTGSLKVVHRSRLVPFDGFIVSRRLPDEYVQTILLVLLGFKQRTPAGRVFMEWRRSTDDTYSF